MSEALIYLADYIEDLQEAIAEIEWENPDDQRLAGLRSDLRQAKTDLANGKTYQPLF